MAFAIKMPYIIITAYSMLVVRLELNLAEQPDISNALDAMY